MIPLANLLSAKSSLAVTYLQELASLCLVRLQDHLLHYICATWTKESTGLKVHFGTLVAAPSWAHCFIPSSRRRLPHIRTKALLFTTLIQCPLLEHVLYALSLARYLQAELTNSILPPELQQPCIFRLQWRLYSILSFLTLLLSGPTCWVAASSLA